VSQQKLARILQVPRSYIYNVESPKHPAKYNVRHINILAWYFDISPGGFFPKQAFEPDDTYSSHRRSRKKNHGPS
jgi:transcriptional regulator with XRE-family HTH domain